MGSWQWENTREEGRNIKFITMNWNTKQKNTTDEKIIVQKYETTKTADCKESDMVKQSVMIYNMVANTYKH